MFDLILDMSLYYLHLIYTKLLHVIKVVLAYYTEWNNRMMDWMYQILYNKIQYFVFFCKMVWFKYTVITVISYSLTSQGWHFTFVELS